MPQDRGQHWLAYLSGLNDACVVDRVTLDRALINADPELADAQRELMSKIQVNEKGEKPT